MKKFFVFILVIAIIATCGFFAYKYFKKEKDVIDEKEFIVTLKDKEIKDENELMFAYGEEYFFNVSKGFSIEILPNADVEESNFFFYVDDTPYYFRAETKLLDAFKVYTYPNNKFSILSPAGTNILKILESIYPEQEVRFKDGEDFSSLESKIFSLVIREKNGNDKVVINFGLAGMTIELPSEIVF